jgi:hypothetical protein
MLCTCSACFWAGKAVALLQLASVLDRSDAGAATRTVILPAMFCGAALPRKQGVRRRVGRRRQEGTCCNVPAHVLPGEHIILRTLSQPHNVSASICCAGVCVQGYRGRGAAPCVPGQHTAQLTRRQPWCHSCAGNRCAKHIQSLTYT